MKPCLPSVSIMLSVVSSGWKVILSGEVMRVLRGERIPSNSPLMLSVPSTVPSSRMVKVRQALLELGWRTNLSLGGV